MKKCYLNTNIFVDFIVVIVCLFCALILISNNNALLNSNLEPIKKGHISKTIANTDLLHAQLNDGTSVSTPVETPTVPNKVYVHRVFNKAFIFVNKKQIHTQYRTINIMIILFISLGIFGAVLFTIGLINKLKQLNNKSIKVLT